jgi:hypothetical protein
MSPRFMAPSWQNLGLNLEPIRRDVSRSTRKLQISQRLSPILGLRFLSLPVEPGILRNKVNARGSLCSDLQWRWAGMTLSRLALNLISFLSCIVWRIVRVHSDRLMSQGINLTVISKLRSLWFFKLTTNLRWT